MDIKGKLSTLSSPLSGPAHRLPRGPDVLSTLRTRMQELLAATGSARAASTPMAPRASDLERSDLPFVAEPHQQGNVWLRRQVLAPSTHVGRIPLEAARDACPQMLALLSLDPELSRCDLSGALFLDTETTGLGGTGSVAFLVGLAAFDSRGQLVLEQLLLRAPEDEAALLEYLVGRLNQASLLITYNGKTFDMPLLGCRFVMHRIRAPRAIPHLDLLHVARRLHKERLGQCRLISLESGVLGFERQEDIPGGEIPPLYGHYLRTGDSAALWPVVEHNALDVMSMAALTGLYGEPVTALHAADLVGLAKTLKRAGALEQAHHVADRALQLGAGPSARLLRGQIAKARGEKGRALADFEQHSQEVDDARVRLELAKLYEHHVKEPLKALDMVALGTSERPELSEKRRERLLLKYSKSKEKSL